LGDFGSVRLARGTSAVVPASAGPLHVRGEKLHVAVSSIE
jgi:hypothetical protein